MLSINFILPPATLSKSIKKFVIHNGINCAELVSSHSNALTGNPALITVGSVTERKGQENVINALPEILSLYPAVQYHIIGKPVIKDKIEKKAQTLFVEKAVHFCGVFNDRKQLFEKLSGGKIKLMLSNHTAEGDFEGFGIAVLEANAFGIPAIGSKNSGIADAIENYKTGILVDQKNKHEVADAVKIIMNNYEVYSANAKLWAMQHDWKIIVKKYINVLNA